MGDKNTGNVNSEDITRFINVIYEEQRNKINELEKELKEINGKNNELSNELMDSAADYKELLRELNQLKKLNSYVKVHKEYELMAASRMGRFLTKIFLFYNKIVSSIKKR